MKRTRGTEFNATSVFITGVETRADGSDVHASCAFYDFERNMWSHSLGIMILFWHKFSCALFYSRLKMYCLSYTGDKAAATRIVREEDLLSCLSEGVPFLVFRLIFSTFFLMA